MTYDVFSGTLNPAQSICTPYLEKLKPTFCRDSWNVVVYIWLQLCQILTDFNNFCSDETGKM